MILFFVAVLALPGLILLTKRSSDSSTEKRQLTAFPTWPSNPAEVKKFPAAFNSWFRDHFGLRNELIRLHAIFTYHFLNTSPSSKVLLGKDGWLFLTHDYARDDFKSRTPFTNAELQRWKEILESRQQWLAAHDAKLLVVFACDKHLIYPEFLPGSVRRQPGSYRIDQLAHFLETHSTVPVISLKESLLEAKANDRLYHRTDTHWNDCGAYVGYREILGQVQEWFPAASPHPIGRYEKIEANTPGWDLAKMLGLPDRIPEKNLSLVLPGDSRAKVVERDFEDPKWNNGRIALEIEDPSLPTVVVFRDSFGSALIPLLSEHFRRSLFLWQYEFDPDVILKEQPEVVILLMTSRRLQWHIPANPQLP